MPQPYLPNY